MTVNVKVVIESPLLKKGGMFEKEFNKPYTIGYKHEGDSGADLLAAIPEAITIYPDEVIKVTTGIKIQITTDGYAPFIFPRSGLGTKGLQLANTVGLIDRGYTGEIIAALRNTSSVPIIIQPLQSIVQLVILPVGVGRFINSNELDNTSRADGGFGSTDRNTL